MREPSANMPIEIPPMNSGEFVQEVGNLSSTNHYYCAAEVEKNEKAIKALTRILIGLNWKNYHLLPVITHMIIIN